MHVIRTDCYQRQRERKRDEYTSGCQTRNVASIISKKQNTIQPCTSKYCQFHHESSSKHILQHIFPKMNCSCTHLKNKTKKSSITANASIHVIRTSCYQHQRKRKHDEITSSCQTRNVKPHNPSFQKNKTPFSHAHQNIVNSIMNYRPNIFCNIYSPR